MRDHDRDDERQRVSPGTGSAIERRNFLSFAAVTTVAAAAVLTVGTTEGDRALARGRTGARGTARTFRGTRDGKIFVSHDGGRSWALLSDFGPHLRVTKIRASARSVVASLALGTYGSFRLRLMHDGRLWHTV